jgi:hypothetical protein
MAQNFRNEKGQSSRNRQELAGISVGRRKSASCDETGRITFSYFIHLSFVFCRHSPPLVLRFYDAAFPALTASQQAQQQESAKRTEGVVKRGEHVMGFSHETTIHHFRLFNDGGEIAVAANDPKDRSSIDQIRSHLGHIAKMFSTGNFDAPMIIHDTNPPGVATMAGLEEQIRYEFSETDRGARIRLVTASPETIDAVHAFLLFQIVDHRTGDAPTISDEFPRK